MLCSHCSEVIKPIVAVDIDGTLGDYHGHFLSFAVDYFGWRHIKLGYDGSIPFKIWWMKEYRATERMWHEVKLAYRQGGMKRTMPIRIGAQALCWTVRDHGAELWMTTTRPYLSLDNIVPDTVEWMRRYDIEYDGMLFDDDKYQQLAKRVDSRRVIAVFDDLQEMCEAAADVLHYGSDVPVLVRNAYNWGSNWPVSTDIDAAADIVLDRIKQWKEQMNA